MPYPRLTALLLVLVTLAVYMPVTRDGFLNYDDDEYITDNQIVQDGLTLAGVKWAFTTGRTGNWHPVTWLSHMTDCELFQLNAGAHHFVNALFHALNAALLFMLLLRLTEKPWPSALVAALFAWHPLHVESVAWIAERKDVLSMFFGLLALLNYVEYARAGSRGRYWLAFIFLALGLLSKPMLVTLPCLFLLLDFWPLRRWAPDTFRVSCLREKIPFFLLAAVSCVITFLAQHNSNAVATLGQVPLDFRLENAAVALAQYLQKLIWPAPLAIIYPLAPIPATTFVMAMAAWSLISVLAWRWRKTRPYFLVGWLWFLGTLMPVIGLVQVGSAAMADRYAYLPSIGVFLAGAFTLPELAEKFPRFKKLLPFGAALLLLGGISLTEWQLHYWHDTETLFRHTLAVTQNNDKAHLNLGVTLEQEDRLPEALAEYRETVRLNPGRFQIRFSMGRLLEKLGQPAAALTEYREAIRCNPRVATWHCAAGSALITLGQFDDARQELTEAETLDANYAQPHIATAKILFRQGHDTKAVGELNAAVQAEPGSFQVLATVAHYFAANENAVARNGHTALALAQKADELSGHVQPMVLDVLGMAYAETGDFTNAVISAQNALELAETAKLKSTESLRKRLELYHNRQPWREAFRTTEVPDKN